MTHDVADVYRQSPLYGRTDRMDLTFGGVEDTDELVVEGTVRLSHGKDLHAALYRMTNGYHYVLVTIETRRSWSGSPDCPARLPEEVYQAMQGLDMIANYQWANRVNPYTP